MAITFVAAATGGSLTNGSGQCTINVPAGTTNGDVMVMNLNSSWPNQTTIAVTGWTAILNYTVNSGNNEYSHVYWRVASSEPASYTINPGNGNLLGSILTYRGVDNSNPIDVTAAAGTEVNSGTTVTAPTVTTVHANSMLVCFFVNRDINTFSQPTGMTERVDSSGPVNLTFSQSADEKLIASPGATGTFDSTTSIAVSVAARAVSLGLRLASTAPAAPTLDSLTPGNAQISAAFTAGSDGGSSITTYKYSTDNGSTYLTRQTGTTASPILITTLSSDGTTPLSNGTSYTVLIKAVNAIGDGTASNSLSATPSTTPSAPTGLVATGGNNRVSVAFTPGSDGGSAITTYKYSTDNGSTFLTRQTGTTASPVVITTLSSDGTTPLVNGSTYQIKLKAVNANGDGTASSAVSGTPGNPTTDLLGALSMRVGGL